MLLVGTVLLAGALERLGQQRVREHLPRDPLSSMSDFPRCRARSDRGVQGFKSKDGPFHPGGYRRGKTARANCVNPRSASLCDPLSMGSAAGCRDWLLRDVVGARPEVASVGVSTVVPGV